MIKDIFRKINKQNKLYLILIYFKSGLVSTASDQAPVDIDKLPLPFYIECETSFNKCFISFTNGGYLSDTLSLLSLIPWRDPQHEYWY